MEKPPPTCTFTVGSSRPPLTRANATPPEPIPRNNRCNPTRDRHGRLSDQGEWAGGAAGQRVRRLPVVADTTKPDLLGDDAEQRDQVLDVGSAGTVIARAEGALGPGEETVGCGGRPQDRDVGGVLLEEVAQGRAVGNGASVQLGLARVPDQPVGGAGERFKLSEVRACIERCRI